LNDGKDSGSSIVVTQANVLGLDRPAIRAAQLLLVCWLVAGAVHDVFGRRETDAVHVRVIDQCFDARQSERHKRLNALSGFERYLWRSSAV
jgi:hypothetical protein